MKTEVHVPIEICFTAKRSYNEFRVRFAPPAEGTYTYRTSCTNTDDAGPHGMTGTIEACEYRGNPKAG